MAYGGRLDQLEPRSMRHRAAIEEGMDMKTILLTVLVVISGCVDMDADVEPSPADVVQPTFGLDPDLRNECTIEAEYSVCCIYANGCQFCTWCFPDQCFITGSC